MTLADDTSISWLNPNNGQTLALAHLFAQISDPLVHKKGVAAAGDSSIEATPPLSIPTLPFRTFTLAWPRSRY